MSDKAKELAEFQGSIAAAITAYGDAAMRFAEGHSTLKEHELIPARRHLEKLIDATVPLGMYERVRRERDFAAAELTRLAEENARLRGITPELGPRPPDGEGLPRYGIRWNGPREPLAVPMNDGYWTPWHLATRAALGAKDKGCSHIFEGRAGGIGTWCSRCGEERDDDDRVVKPGLLGAKGKGER